SIGGPPTHTSRRADIAGMARGTGIEHAYAVDDLGEFERLCEEGVKAKALYIIVAKVEAAVEPGIRRKHSDGREDKYIFVRHVERTEGIVIMGPSEHN
ncbi:MAG: thiamine pyrophosphate-binding protein, partial [Nitrospinota bacterium]